MPKATWNGAVIAQASEDEVHIVEGNVYFPFHAVNHDFLRPSAHTSQCGWKGTANYFDLVVDGSRNENAAWIYRVPKDAAREIAGHIAFWHGVQVDR
jgi:uncharacterized protein (DUF427 family)